MVPKSAHMRRAIGLFAVSLALALPAPAEGAEIAWRQVTKPKVINTDQIAREGTATFKDGSTATVRMQGAFDKTDPKVAKDVKDAKGVKEGTFKAKSLLNFPDGSTITTRYAGKVDSASFASSGAGEFVSGTGRFKGIKGKVTFDGRLSESEWTGEYTLPKK